MLKKFFLYSFIFILMAQIILAQCVKEGEEVFVERNSTSFRLENLSTNCCKGLYAVPGSIQLSKPIGSLHNPTRFDHYYTCNKEIGPSSEMASLFDILLVIYAVLVFFAILILSTVASSIIIEKEEKETGKSIFLRYFVDFRVNWRIGMQVTESLLGSTKYFEDKSFKITIILLRIAYVLFILVFVFKLLFYFLYSLF
jgi:hypothetical protein